MTSWRYLLPAEAETRGEPETVDVYAEQGAVDWTLEPRSDALLARHARSRLELELDRWEHLRRP